MRSGVAAALAVGMFTVGCGGSDSSTESEEQQVTPEQARVEVDEVREGLQQAIATYRSGDRAAADEQVGDTYLKHFELVEGPLEKADEELNEKLEDSIREELREMIKSGAPKAKVAALHQEITADLEKAEAALR